MKVKELKLLLDDVDDELDIIIEPATDVGRDVLERIDIKEMEKEVLINEPRNPALYYQIQQGDEALGLSEYTVTRVKVAILRTADCD